jgi:hypothetical protein
MGVSMKVYLLDIFSKDIKKENISNIELIATAKEVVEGLYDAKLGHNFYKKRIALNNQGKRSSARTIVTIVINNSVIFLHYFKKNEKSNIKKSHQADLKKISIAFQSLDENSINVLIEQSHLIEIKE